MVSGSKVLATEEAFAAVVCTRYIENTCAMCLLYTPDQTQIPCACGWVFYCSEDCYDIDRYKHTTEECRLYKRLKRIQPRGPLTEHARLIIRILLRTEEDLDNVEGLHGRTWESLNADEHQAKLTLRPSLSLLKEFKDILNTAVLDEGLIIEPSIDVTINRVFLNAIHIFDISNGRDPVGLAIYLGFDVSRNNCLSKNYLIFKGTEATLRSLDPETMLTTETDISFLPRIPFSLNRKEAIRQMFGYDCKCPLCDEPHVYEDYNLKATSCNSVCHTKSYGFLTSTGYICTVCFKKLEVTEAQVQEVQKKIRDFMNRLFTEQDARGDSDEMMQAITDYINRLNIVLDSAKLLSPINHHMIDILILRRQLYARRRAINGAPMANEVMEYERHHDSVIRRFLIAELPYGHPDLTHFFLDVADFTFWRIHSQKNAFLMDQALHAVKFTYGEGHPVVRKISQTVFNFNYAMIPQYNANGQETIHFEHMLYGTNTANTTTTTDESEEDLRKKAMMNEEEEVEDKNNNNKAKKGKAKPKKKKQE